MARLSVLAAAAFVVSGAQAGIPTTRLSNGVELPMVTAGTFLYNESEAEASVRNALTIPGLAIDTAFDYGNQRGVGRAIKDVPRKDVFLITKVGGCGVDGKVRAGHCYEDTKAAFQDNLDQLETPYVDLMLLHFPPAPSFVLRTCSVFACPMVQNQWRAMEEMYKAGKARAIGVSNYCPSCFQCIFDNATVMPVVNQVLYNAQMGLHHGGFKTYADAHNVTFQAYSPLGSDLLNGLLHKQLMADKDLNAIAAAHNRSIIEVALKYIIDQGIPLVTKSSSRAHLLSDVDLWSWSFNITEKQIIDDKQSPMPFVSYACNFMSQPAFV